MPHPSATSVLFVCLGNICRSPLAEGIFRHEARARGIEDHFRIDSAGTGAWHVGEPPDSRAADVAEDHGVSLDGQRSRPVHPDDFETFDLVVAMDRENLRDLEALRPSGPGGARLVLLRDHDPEPGDGEVPDPYFGGEGGFERVFRILQRSVSGLLDDLGP